MAILAFCCGAVICTYSTHDRSSARCTALSLLFKRFEGRGEKATLYIYSFFYPNPRPIDTDCLFGNTRLACRGEKHGFTFSFSLSVSLSLTPLPLAHSSFSLLFKPLPAFASFARQVTLKGTASLRCRSYPPSRRARTTAKAKDRLQPPVLPALLPPEPTSCWPTGGSRRK